MPSFYANSLFFCHEGQWIMKIDLPVSILCVAVERCGRGRPHDSRSGDRRSNPVVVNSCSHCNSLRLAGVIFRNPSDVGASAPLIFGFVRFPRSGLRERGKSIPQGLKPRHLRCGWLASPGRICAIPPLNQKTILGWGTRHRQQTRFERDAGHAG